MKNKFELNNPDDAYSRSIDLSQDEINSIVSSDSSPRNDNSFKMFSNKRSNTMVNNESEVHRTQNCEFEPVIPRNPNKNSSCSLF
jgi:hypothetical protein